MNRIVDPLPEFVARRFHEHYERLAPEYGYQTRRDSAVPWDEVPQANRQLMIRVAAEVLADLTHTKDSGTGDGFNPSIPHTHTKDAGVPGA